MAELLIQIFEINDEDDRKEIGRGYIRDSATNTAHVAAKFTELEEPHRTFLSDMVMYDNPRPWHLLLKALLRTEMGLKLSRR